MAWRSWGFHSLARSHFLECFLFLKLSLCFWPCLWSNSLLQYTKKKKTGYLSIWPGTHIHAYNTWWASQERDKHTMLLNLPVSLNKGPQVWLLLSLIIWKWWADFPRRLSMALRNQIQFPLFLSLAVGTPWPQECAWSSVSPCWEISPGKEVCIGQGQLPRPSLKFIIRTEKWWLRS